MKFLRILLETHLQENFQLATKEWTANNDINDVNQTINLFKDLVNKNKVFGVERDINHWRKIGFDGFKRFVTQTKSEIENANTKGNRKKAIKAASDDILTVKKTGDMHLFIPLSKEASCFYAGGDKTPWCISTRDGKNHFYRYTVESGYIIFFLTYSEEIYSLVVNKDMKVIECQDKLNNNSFPVGKFLSIANVNMDMLKNFIHKHYDEISSKLNSEYEKDENPESKLKELKQLFDVFHIMRGVRIQPKNGVETQVSIWFNNNFKFFKDRESITKLKEFCTKSAMAAYYFASHTNKRFIEGESAIAKDAKFSFGYAKLVLRGRFENGELTISNDFDYAVQYATDVLKGRFEKAEPVIARSRRATDEYIDFFDGKANGEEIENHMMRLHREWKAKNS
jgi:hypothetical protein